MGFNPFKDPECAWGDPPRAGECDPYRFTEVGITELISASVKYAEHLDVCFLVPLLQQLAEEGPSRLSTRQ